MRIEKVSFLSQGQAVSGVLHLPELKELPCVIASHGLFSSKESEKFVEIAEFFSANGIAAIRYDHQGCGESEGEIGETTVSSRIRDLDAMFELAVNHPLLGHSIGLLGSSMGGFISLFKGATEPRVKALALWATPSHLGAGRNKVQDEAPSLHEAFYEDVKRYDARQVIKGAAHCLILHGEADELVPVSQAEEVYKCVRHPKHLEVFEGGDHRFTDPHHRRRAIELSLNWFKKYL